MRTSSRLPFPAAAFLCQIANEQGRVIKTESFNGDGKMPDYDNDRPRSTKPTEKITCWVARPTLFGETSMILIAFCPHPLSPPLRRRDRNPRSEPLRTSPSTYIVSVRRRRPEFQISLSLSLSELACLPVYPSCDYGVGHKAIRPRTNELNFMRRTPSLQLRPVQHESMHT